MKEWNVPNTIANSLMLPLALLCAGAFFKYINLQVNLIQWVYFCLLYLWSSWMFQPDLDHEENRPGKYTFPSPWKTKYFLSEAIHFCFIPLKIIGLYRLFPVVKVVFFSPFEFLRICWLYLWVPYSTLLTHRGISHLPIIGALSRFLYLGIPWFLYKVLNHQEILTYRYFEEALKMLIPGWGRDLGVVDVLLTSIYLSDIFHSSVDLAESIVKGNRFCSFNNKSGLLAKIFIPGR